MNVSPELPVSPELNLSGSRGRFAKEDRSCPAEILRETEIFDTLERCSNLVLFNYKLTMARY